jgi:hypothetical protein
LGAHRLFEGPLQRSLAQYLVESYTIFEVNINLR